ncbi:MAG: CRISPR-associated endonuclease Cas2 [Clostridiales bacterium]|jgi:CRISPR-associated protein Cas2|nr:CRISPR-associated endonuclease Cas2 [Clostridiales bacterium]
MRDCVILVSFDLPSQNSAQRSDNNYFRRNLIKSGYSLLQKSVYYRHIRNSSMREYEILHIQKIAPRDGEVFVLPVPLKTLNKWGGFKAAYFLDRN